MGTGWRWMEESVSAPRRRQPAVCIQDVPIKIREGEKWETALADSTLFLVVLVSLSVWGAAAALSQTLSLDDQSAMVVGEEVTFTHVD